MKRKFILPAAFALTVHAFVLFGLTGKTPPVVVAPERPTATLKQDELSINTEKPVRDTTEITDETPPEGPVDLLPRLLEIPNVTAPPGCFTVVPLPPVTGIPSIKVIGAHWQEPGGTGTTTRVEILEPSMLDHVPRARSQPAPIYPNDMRQLGIGGSVMVEFKVDLEGNVYSATVLSATHPGFIEAALRAVEHWKFEPGRRGNAKVRFRMSVPLVFKIEDV
jgi:protein TonB